MGKALSSSFFLLAPIYIYMFCWYAPKGTSELNCKNCTSFQTCNYFNKLWNGWKKINFKIAYFCAKLKIILMQCLFDTQRFHYVESSFSWHFSFFALRFPQVCSKTRQTHVTSNAVGNIPQRLYVGSRGIFFNEFKVGGIVHTFHLSNRTK